MARGRMISSTIQNSKKILAVMDAEPKMHEFVWLLYSWIMPQTDDFGHFDADPRVVKAKVLPCSDRKVKDFKHALDVLEKVGLIIIYGEGPFLEIVGFFDHQTLRKDRPHIPMFPERTELNTRKHNGLPMTPVGLPVTPISEVKLIEVKLSKDKYKDCVYLEKGQHEKLVKRFGDRGTDERIQCLNDGIMSKGYVYKSHYHTILSWERKNAPKSTAEAMQDKHAGALAFARKVVE